MVILSSSSAAAASLEIWMQMVENHDMSRLPEIAHPDVVFRSPVSHKDYHSIDALVLALSHVIRVFENFRYHRFFFTEDGTGAVLEFSASVGDKQLKGVDLVQFDANGKITDFEVMVRPLSALQALAVEMGARVGETLPKFSKT